MMIPECCRCCICGRSTVKGGAWNGLTNKEYCHKCAIEHFHDGEPNEGQSTLEAWED